MFTVYNVEYCVSEQQGNILDCKEAHPSPKFSCCNVHKTCLSVVCYFKVMLGQFMRFWYLSHAKEKMYMKVQAKLYGTVQETFVFIALCEQRRLL